MVVDKDEQNVFTKKFIATGSLLTGLIVAKELHCLYTSLNIERAAIL
jgi:hypothetical protein